MQRLECTFVAYALAKWTFYILRIERFCVKILNPTLRIYFLPNRAFSPNYPNLYSRSLFPALKPTFRKRPVEAETYAGEGGNVTIKCNPEAAPRPKFTWKKDGNVIGELSLKIMKNCVWRRKNEFSRNYIDKFSEEKIKPDRKSSALQMEIHSFPLWPSVWFLSCCPEPLGLTADNVKIPSCLISEQMPITSICCLFRNVWRLQV